MSGHSASHKMQVPVSRNAASIYMPLDATLPEIRLLRLMPSADLYALIECQLSIRPLDEASGSYESLSYVWGSPRLIRQIQLNGGPVCITRNLETALRYLRLPASERVLWVDALCINQSDSVERSQQVRLMKDIYDNGAADLAWMLEHEESEDANDADEQNARILKSINDMSEAMKLIRNITLKDAKTLADIKVNDERIRKLTGRDFDKESVMYSFDARTKAEKHIINYDATTSLNDAEIMAGIETDGKARVSTNKAGTEVGEEKNDKYFLDWDQYNFLSATFSKPCIWERVWTMQELSLAPRVVLVAGHYQLDWSIIADFFADQPYADAFHASFGHGLYGTTLNSALGGAQKVDQQRRILRHGHYGLSLLDVLTRFQSNKATDPRDRIYGLLGLVKGQHSIMVDYNKPVSEVFEDAAMSLIRTSGNLDLLCQTTFTTCAALEQKVLGKGVLESQSWVPDFSQQVRYDAYSQILFAQRGIYASGRPCLEGPWDTARARGLQLRAIVLGRLDTEIPKVVPMWDKGWLRLHEIFEEYDIKSETVDAEEPKTYIPTGETAFRAVWRTLLMDCIAYPITRLKCEDISTGEGAFRNLLEHQGGPSRPTTDSMARRNRARLSLPEPMREMMHRNIPLWTFCVTSNGLYTMVQKVKEGDVIASVEGAKVPLVLRPKGEIDGKAVYTLVGTAYTHGYMDGEALRMAAEGKLDEEELYLQ